MVEVGGWASAAVEAGQGADRVYLALTPGGLQHSPRRVVHFVLCSVAAVEGADLVDYDGGGGEEGGEGDCHGVP